MDSVHPVLADNVGTAVRKNGWGRSHDDEIVVKHVDRMGLSFYVKNNTNDAYEDWERCQLLESIAFASPDSRFRVAEMQSHHRALFNPSGTVSAEDIRMWNWEALSRGANAIVYWKWEPFIKEHQTFGRGLVNHKGKYMPRALENGTPAVTETGYGKGKMIHPLTMFWYGVYETGTELGRELVRYLSNRFRFSKHSCVNNNVQS